MGNPRWSADGTVAYLDGLGKS